LLSSVLAISTVRTPSLNETSIFLEPASAASWKEPWKLPRALALLLAPDREDAPVDLHRDVLGLAAREFGRHHVGLLVLGDVDRGKRHLRASGPRCVVPRIAQHLPEEGGAEGVRISTEVRAPDGKR
jgi:hypothetical protein